MSGIESDEPSSDFEFETPAELFARLKLGREEFLQRLLTSLLLRAPYPKWNTRSKTSPEGIAFLRDLHAACFDVGWPSDDFTFVDEFELPARTPEEKGGYPDYALLWDDKIWIIELKTERGSHRPDQIPMYFAYARHHHPDCAIDLSYLTGPGSKSGMASEPWERFCHLEWSETAGLLERHWPDPDLPGQVEVLEGIRLTIESLRRPARSWQADFANRFATAAPAHEEPDPMEALLELTDVVADDHAQRAFEFEASSLDQLHELRLAVGNRLASLPVGDSRRHIVPWVWKSTSGGRALTAFGRECGFELRLSHYRKPQAFEVTS